MIYSMAFTAPLFPDTVGGWLPEHDLDADFWASRERLGAVRCHGNRPCCRQSGLYSATFAEPRCLETVHGTPRGIRVQVAQRGPRLPPPNIPYNAYETASVFFPIPQIDMSLHTGGTTDVTETGTMMYDPRGRYNKPDEGARYLPFAGPTDDIARWLDSSSMSSSLRLRDRAERTHRPC